MHVRPGKALAILGVGLALQALLWARDDAPPPADPPPVPQGVEVMARGPIHEAFATPTAEAQPTKAVPKEPPKLLDELPPEEKPEGDMTWIGGYWAWDDERSDFIWVSGIWRSVPRGRQWVAGYWRADGGQWQWVPGFWSEAAAQDTGEKEVTYLPPPPAAPQVAAPGEPPDQTSFYVPGYYVWAGDHYAWKAGYWARVVPGYVWVPAHYRWTPTGYVFIPGYWDLAVSRRGVLYAPVVVDTAVVGPTFVYTPAYAVNDTIVLDALFVRPSYCHYYFGDYYGVTYRDYGFESCYVYSRRHYDAIIVYERYERRHEPRWVDIQINLYNDRYAGRAPVPPRTLVQQNNINVVQKNVINQNVIVNNVTNVNNVNVVNNTKNVTNTPVLVPTSQLAAARGTKVVAVDNAARAQAKQQAQAVQQVALQRNTVEKAVPGAKPAKPIVTSLKVPPTPPVMAAKPAISAANPGPSQPAAKPAMPPVAPKAQPSVAKPAVPPAAPNVGVKPAVNALAPQSQPGGKPQTPIAAQQAPAGRPVVPPGPAAKPEVAKPTAPVSVPGQAQPKAAPGTAPAPPNPNLAPATAPKPGSGVTAPPGGKPATPTAAPPTQKPSTAPAVKPGGPNPTPPKTPPQPKKDANKPPVPGQPSVKRPPAQPLTPLGDGGDFLPAFASIHLYPIFDVSAG